MSDKTLFEIIEAVKTNQPVDTEDLKYALLALSWLLNSANGLLLKLYHKDKTRLFDMLIENNHKANNSALNKAPRKWLGWDNDPANPAYQRFHQAGLALADKAIRGELGNKPVEVSDDDDDFYVSEGHAYKLVNELADMLIYSKQGGMEGIRNSGKVDFKETVHGSHQYTYNAKQLTEYLKTLKQ